MRILLADADQEIVDILNIYLINEGYEVIHAFDGEETKRLLTSDQPIDLLICDSSLPTKTGLELVKEMREEHLRIPVILISNNCEDHDKIEGLISGADDYITKPFNPLEVMARVKSILRRQYDYAERESSDTIKAGPLLISRDSHEVKTAQGQQIQLTALEFGILYLLASHPNRVFSADEIFKEVWHQEHVVSAKTVMVHVSHLRDKLASIPGGDNIIQTVWGVGYKIES